MHGIDENLEQGLITYLNETSKQLKWNDSNRIFRGQGENDS
jgi:hypothetical protein